MKKILVLLLCLGLCGCATMQNSNPNFATTVDEATNAVYTSDKGKELAKKYNNDLINIYNALNSKFQGQVVFIKRGFGISYDIGNPNSYYVALSLAVPALVYNTLQSDFNKRSATTFSRYGKDILETIIAEKGIFASGDLTAVDLIISWEARDFLQSQYFGGEWESIEIFADIQSCQDFLNFKISNQSFINKSKVLGMQGKNVLGRIEVDLKDTM